MMRLHRKMIAASGPGWAVSDYDGETLTGRWATEEDATEEGLLGIYLLSGFDVVEISSEERADAPR